MLLFCRNYIISLFLLLYTVFLYVRLLENILSVFYALFSSGYYTKTICDADYTLWWWWWCNLSVSAFRFFWFLPCFRCVFFWYFYSFCIHFLFVCYSIASFCINIPRSCMNKKREIIRRKDFLYLMDFTLVWPFFSITVYYICFFPHCFFV